MLDILSSTCQSAPSATFPQLIDDASALPPRHSGLRCYSAVWSRDSLSLCALPQVPVSSAEVWAHRRQAVSPC